jgi:hypothetical protein
MNCVQEDLVSALRRNTLRKINVGNAVISRKVNRPCDKPLRKGILVSTGIRLVYETGGHDHKQERHIPLFQKLIG